jgi:hypothetical protein
LGENPKKNSGIMGCMYSKKKDMAKIKLSELIRTEGQTGDIILFEGWSVFGLFEECVTTSPYSHVAMLVRDPVTKDLYVWESSNADDLVDHISNQHKDGPRLINAHDKIGEYLSKYGTGIIYRRLVKPRKSTVFSPSTWSWLSGFMKRESPKHFEKFPLTMAESWTHTSLPSIQGDLSSVFCSEEVANTWIQAGVPLYRPADKYCPQDFSAADQNLFNRRTEAMGWGLSQPFNIIVDF